MGQPRPIFIVYFRSFQTNITIFTTNICEKYPSSIWCWDSNPRPSEQESPPITTRPGLYRKYLMQNTARSIPGDSGFSRTSFGPVDRPTPRAKFPTGKNAIKLILLMAMVSGNILSSGDWRRNLIIFRKINCQ